MAITYNEQTREFHLQTNQSSYIFTVLENEQLEVAGDFYSRLFVLHMK
ncbi:hypothetical protein [Gracilibacillus saliphilus]|nr:hypothetical protein [Gracilibacillus saliphilus]